MMRRKAKGKRRRLTISFILASILLHLLIFLIVSLFLVYSQNRQAKTPSEKPQFIEITELPVPKDKETKPPKEIKRLAERSHEAPEEKTRDDFTKQGSVARIPKPQQPPQKKQQKVVKKKVEEPKKQETKKKTKKIASIPKDILKDSIRPKKQIEDKKDTEITKEELFNSSPSQFARQQKSSRDFKGARDVKRKEDTVDLNTTEFRYLSYFLKLKRQIEGVWNYPETSRIRGEQGELLLIFTIRSDGYLENVRMLNSSGYRRLDDEAIRAIRVAAPFSPFPRSWDLERLNIRAIFRYSFGWSIR
ncbi:MAG: TonB family protein [Thermodesulfobacteriota bacterium]